MAWTALEAENETSCRYTRRTTRATKAVAVRNDPTAVGRKSRHQISTDLKTWNRCQPAQLILALGYFRSHGCADEFFFEGLGKIDEGKDQKKSILEDEEALELVRCYSAIPEYQHKRLFDFARVSSDAA